MAPVSTRRLHTRRSPFKNCTDTRSTNEVKEEGNTEGSREVEKTEYLRAGEVHFETPTDESLHTRGGVTCPEGEPLVAPSGRRHCLRGDFDLLRAAAVAGVGGCLHSLAQ